jgi:hypothetical protein
MLELIIVLLIVMWLLGMVRSFDPRSRFRRAAIEAQKGSASSRRGTRVDERAAYHADGVNQAHPSHMALKITGRCFVGPTDG